MVIFLERSVIVKEIGGYIELDKYTNKEYHSNAIALNSGRHAVEYVIKAKNIKKMYVPDYLCASIRNICEKCKCSYEIYEVSSDFMPNFKKEIYDDECLYIVNYFGQIGKKQIKQYKNKYKNIIVDNAQAFFEKPIKGIDTVYTCRKFFGVPDGGYLYTDTYLNDELKTDLSYDRIKYILGRFELDAGTFYKDSVENNKFFADESLKNMSKLTHNLLRAIDYTRIKKKRTQNFLELHRKLKEINGLELHVPKGAFMYPLYLKNGNDVKKKLIQEKIFVPTLWSDTFDVALESSVACDYTNNIVLLPVDQRYDEKDMKYIAKEVLKCID